MFSSILNTTSRFKQLTCFANQFYSGKSHRCLCTLNIYYFNNFVNNQVKDSRAVSCSIIRDFCSQHAKKKENIFGELAYNSYEAVEMDEAEKEEEEFAENEFSVPKWQKLSPGQYAKLVKSHLTKGDVWEALKVLDQIKQNRDKPTLYIFNLLIYGFATQGHLDQCFKLYNNMKKRGLIPTAPTYTSLFNACALSKSSSKALEKLHNLRAHLYKIEFPLNTSHYNVMIKAYSFHGKTIEAFQLVDEMIDKGVYVAHSTYAFLLHAAISDKEAGLRYALNVWHIMQARKVKAAIHHYNLLLRAIRDTKLGKIKKHDTFLSGSTNAQIHLSTEDNMDLLTTPPVLNPMILSEAKKQLKSNQKDNALDVKIENPEAKLMVVENLDDLLEANPLILFGGFQTILNRMEKDGVTPTAVTLTVLMGSLPKTLYAENALIKYAKKKNINLDIDFFNMLIKRRSMRFEYAAAKEVLAEMQIRNFRPDIITFGVLALGCVKYKDGVELLEGMESVGFAPNAVILGTLLRNACTKIDFPYISYLLNCVLEYQVKPSKKMLENLETFEKLMIQTFRSKKKLDRAYLKRIKDGYKVFKEEYSAWLKKVQ